MSSASTTGGAGAQPIASRSNSLAAAHDADVTEVTVARLRM